MNELLCFCSDRPAMNGQTEEDVGASCEHVFDQFVTAVTCKTILSSFQQLLDLTGLRHADHRHFYEKLKAKLKGSWKAQSLWVKLDKRAAHRDYAKQQSCADMKVSHSQYVASLDLQLFIAKSRVRRGHAGIPKSGNSKSPVWTPGR